MVLAEMSLYPLGQGESVSQFVAACVDVIDRSGLDYECHAMGTIVEGEFDQVMAVFAECYRALATHCDRVEAVLKLDSRKGRAGTLRSKVEAVERKLGRPVRK